MDVPDIMSDQSLNLEQLCEKFQEVKHINRNVTQSSDKSNDRKKFVNESYQMFMNSRASFYKDPSESTTKFPTFFDRKRASQPVITNLSLSDQHRNASHRLQNHRKSESMTDFPYDSIAAAEIPQNLL